MVPGLQLVLVFRQEQSLPDRYRACLLPGQAFWRANQQLYLPLEDTVRRSRYVVYLQPKESVLDRQVGPLDSLVLQTP